MIKQIKKKRKSLIAKMILKKILNKAIMRLIFNRQGVKVKRILEEDRVNKNIKNIDQKRFNNNKMRFKLANTNEVLI